MIGAVLGRMRGSFDYSYTVEVSAFHSDPVVAYPESSSYQQDFNLCLF